MNTESCECCGEHPVWPEAAAHGYRWCEECSRSTLCAECDEKICDDDLLQWDIAYCDRCQARRDRHEWIDTTEAAVREAAEASGWSMDLRSQAGTGSRYYDLSRGDEIVTLRISDHGDCYCSADYSIAMQPSGDDTTLAVVVARLRK